MRGKITAIALAILMSTVSLSVVLMPGTSGETGHEESPFAGGTGSIGDPYIIENVWELQNMSDDLTAHYALGNDIIATETTGWNLNGTSGAYEGFVPIAYDTVNSTEITHEGPLFSGSLDGMGFDIYGLFMNRTSSYQALFGGMAVGSIVKNLTLYGVDITGKNYTAGIGGYCLADIIENCVVYGDITGIDYLGGIGGYADPVLDIINCQTRLNLTGNQFLGGIIGRTGGTVKMSSADVYASATGSNAGGLIGFMNNGALLENCQVSGTFSSTTSYAGGAVGQSFANTNILNTTSDIQLSGLGYLGGIIGASNSGIINCTTSGTTTGSGGNVGGLIGWMTDGLVESCTTYGYTTGTTDVGGLIGETTTNTITINNSTAYGDVNGTTGVAGLIANNDADIYGCSAHGMVNGSNDDVGGLLGYNTGGVNMSHATGDVGSSGGIGHGGLIGYTIGTVTLSYATGNVYGVDDVGGLCGYSDIEISQSFALGDVTATGDNAGGLVGNKWGSSVTDCYAQGDVIGLQNVGGLIGQNYNGVFTSYSTGNASGTLPEVGGFIGYRGNGGINDCYFDNQTSGTDIEIGVIGGGPAPDITPYNTTEMMMQATFTNWDFTSIWGIHENYTYPFLQAYAYLTPPPSADLEITIVDSADPVMVSDTLHYYVTVTNHGTINAIDVNATIHLPTEVLHMSTNQTTIFWGLGNISWEIGNMTPGQVVFWEINVTVQANGIMNCTVNVNATTYDEGLYPNDGYELTSTNQAPVAVNDAPSVLEDSGANTIDVLANDIDDGPLNITGVTQPLNGTVTFTTDDLAYEPDADFNGINTFTYTITDAYGATDTATVTVTVTNTNDAPVAVDDTATADENGGIIYIDVLANDGDIDLDSLTIDAITQGTDGTVMLETGNVSYEPDADFSGNDTFTYTIIDGNGGSDTATVNVTVVAVTATNQAPVAVNDTATVLEDSDATTIEVLDNDSDPDGDTLTISAVTQPTNGAVAIIDSGLNVTYVPDPDFFGIDTFTYTIGDGSGLLVNAIVTVTVTNVNDVPVIEDFTAPAGTIGVEYDLVIGVTDVDNDTLIMSVTITTPDSALSIGTNAFTSSFIVNGTPTMNSTSMVHLEVDDGNGGIASLFFNITVGSGVPDPTDNTTAIDTDGDGVPDVDDAFPNDATEDTDTDGDGTGDNADAFPNDATEDTDTDDDGTGDNEDTDDDGDGIPDVDDDTPTGDDDDDDDAEDEGSILDYWWIFLIIVVVLVLILILGRKKDDDDEEEVSEEPSEEEDPEESDEDEEDLEDEEPEDEEDLEEEEDSEEPSNEETDVDEEK